MNEKPKDGRSDHCGSVIRNNFFYTSRRITNADAPILGWNSPDAKILSRNDAQAEVYGNITQATPKMFADPATCDLHLKSPITGVVRTAEKLRRPLSAADFADDFNGHPRPMDAANDIGADEHRSTPAANE